MRGCHLVYGLVSDTKAGFAKVQLPDFDGVVTDWLPVIKTRAMNDDVNWPLEINEQVACMVDEYGDTGVILGAISSAADVPDGNAGAGKWRKSFSDGTSIEYDKNAHKMTVAVGDSSGEIDVRVNNTKVSVTDGKVDVVDGSGGELTMAGGMFTVKNGSVDLKNILTNICTHIEALTVLCASPGDPSGPPVNIADFISDAVDITALLS